MSADQIVRHYFDCFNERRFADAAALFANDSRFAWISFADPQRGRDGYLEFVQRWAGAFPNGRLRVEQRGDRMCEVDLLATGTHIGTLDMGIYHFWPTHANISIRLRQLFEFNCEQIIYASVSVDSQELVRQLTTLDFSALDAHLDQIVRLRAELAETRDDDLRLRELAERLGRELDAAWHILRPYYRR